MHTYRQKLGGKMWVYYPTYNRIEEINGDKRK